MLIVFAALSVFAWATDKISMQGERTVYTAECVSGEWQADRCTGRLAAARRFRFRALKAHGEVLFWTVGERAPSGKFTECSIVDGHNWACVANEDAVRTIAHQMRQGQPVPDAAVATIPYHPVPKWKWYLLRVGVPAGQEATGQVR
jgi:hypothetical protein